MLRSFLLIVALCCMSCAWAQKGAPRSAWLPKNVDSVYKGTAYVPFDVATLDGRHINNANCKGKVVFLDFWFEGCSGCRGDFDKLNTLYDSLKNDPSYVFLSVTFDAPETIPGFLKQYNLRYPVATTTEPTVREMNYHQGFPSKAIIDKEGKIAYIGMQYFPKPEDVPAIMRRLKNK